MSKGYRLKMFQDTELGDDNRTSYTYCQRTEVMVIGFRISLDSHSRSFLSPCGHFQKRKISLQDVQVFKFRRNNPEGGGETWRVGDGMERAKGNFFTADKTSISSNLHPKQVFVLPQMQAKWSLQTVSQTSRQEFSVFHPHMTTKLFHVRVTWTLVCSCLENCVCVSWTRKKIKTEERNRMKFCSVSWHDQNILALACCFFYLTFYLARPFSGYNYSETAYHSGPCDPQRLF